MSDMKDLELLFGESVVLGHVCDSAYLALEAQFMNEQAAAAAVDLRILQENGTEEHRKTLMMALEAESAEKEAGFITKLKEAFAKLMNTISKFFSNLMAKIRKDGAKSGTAEVTEEQAGIIQAVKNVGKDIKTICSKLASKDLAGAYEYINTEAGWIKWYGIIVGAGAALTAAKHTNKTHRTVKAKIDDLKEAADTAYAGSEEITKVANKLQAVDTILFFGHIVVDKLDGLTKDAREGAAKTIKSVTDSVGKKIDGNKALATCINVMKEFGQKLQVFATWAAKIILNPIGTAAEAIGGAAKVDEKIKQGVDKFADKNAPLQANDLIKLGEETEESVSLESIAGFRAMFMTESAEPVEEVTTTNSIIDDILAKFQSKE